MEKELHECGLNETMGIPYWNWALYTDLETSPMFDGSETSLGKTDLTDDQYSVL
jgi:hypothetical protein